MKLGKILLCFKCPDAVYYAVDNHLDQFDEVFFQDENNPDYDTLGNLIKDKLSKFVKWGEVITIEIDLYNETARVCENVRRE